MAAALALVREQRVERISVATIAALASVSIGGFYARFPSKEALFQYLYADVFEQLVGGRASCCPPRPRRTSGRAR